MRLSCRTWDIYDRSVTDAEHWLGKMADRTVKIVKEKALCWPSRETAQTPTSLVEDEECIMSLCQLLASYHLSEEKRGSFY